MGFPGFLQDKLDNLFYYLLPDERPENLGDNDTAIGLLVVLHDGDENSGQG